MRNKILKKSVAIFMLLSIIFSSISNIVFAKSVGNEAYLENKGDCGFHLQYHNEEKNGWFYIKCTYVTYSENGNEYPAYCLNQEFPGVGEKENYTVDLTQTLDDVRIWRVITNGYPYKTPGELGLENQYDAFVATKQAVYSIIYGFDPVTKYRGEDDRGRAITNAIIRLVDIGRNGTQTPYTAGITVNKVGNLVEDGNDYVQEFSPNCGASTRNYTITATAGLPSGSRITDINNNETTTFDGNSNFKVRIPKSSMNADINAVFSMQASAKVYPVFYGKTRIDGTQNYAITCDPYGDITGVGNFKIATNTGKVQVNKTDDETKQPISGVTFQLLRKDGSVVGNATTNDKGIATFSGLYQDNYILKEISTDENYILNKAEFDVNVEYNKTSAKDITNEHKKGDLKVYKVDKDNHKIALGDVKFDLYSEEFKKVIGTYTTNVDGEISIKNLRTGRIYFN